ncbi:MAG TPA: hypothetical protein VF528_06585 [Pyrinomonadaceae bacterium]|jgi:hypothetical protein
MKTFHAPLRQRTRLALWCSATFVLVLLSTGAVAQSTNIEFPTPVRTNEISGTIAPRDVGDARLTRYFYSLSGTNGDLVVTVESRNLNGDVDLFTAGTLRPLVKLSMYASDAASTTSKTIYFKRGEALILRVEARSPNDAEGSFRIRFDGAFAPFMGEAREPEPINPLPPSTAATGGKTRRVTATGARIDEPVVEATARTTDPESRTTTPATNTPITENPPDAAQPATTETEATPRPTARASRTRRPRRPPTRTARNRPTPPVTPEQPPARTEQPAASTEQPTQPEPVPAGPRLIIETKDGLRVERYMTSVRRVTVDNGQIIIVLKSGKVERQPMTNVLKMSIEP